MRHKQKRCHNTSSSYIVIVKLDFDKEDQSNVVEWLSRIFPRVKSPEQDIIIKISLLFWLEEPNWDEYVDS